MQSIPAYQTSQKSPNKIVLELGARFRSGLSSSSLLDLPSPESAPLAILELGWPGIQLQGQGGRDHRPLCAACAWPFLCKAVSPQTVIIHV